MRFLFWLVDFKRRRRHDIRRYQNGRVANKIITMLLITLYAILPSIIVGLSIQAANTSILLFLLLIVTGISLSIFSLESMILYIYLGFSTAIRSKLEEDYHLAWFDIVIALYSIIGILATILLLLLSIGALS